ncbi:hypothetical protein Ndes2526B_g03989 [Nannochloris sp. 'desiccata']
MKLKATPSLYTSEGISPLPIVVATTKAYARKSLVDQAAAFTAVVARSLEDVVRRNPDFPRGLNVRDCFQEAATKSTANGFLIAKFTIVNPAIIACIAQLTDSSPLLPIKEPNPGFIEIKLSWENRIGKYYRLLDVPQGLSVEGLVNSINSLLPCKYVDTHKGPGGYPVVAQHVVEFTVPSARDIPPEFTLPHQLRNKKAYSVRVLHVPTVDNKIANGLARVPLVEWMDTHSAPTWHSGSPISQNGASFARQAPLTPAGPSAWKSGKAVKNDNSPAQIAHQNFLNARNKQHLYQNKLANNEKAAVAKKAAEERAAAAAAEAAVVAAQKLKATVAKAKAESEAYVRQLVMNSISAAFERHAPEEAAAIKAAAAAADAAAADATADKIEALRLQRSKRVRADSDQDEDEDVDDGDNTRMLDADTSKNDSKKAKEADIPSPMVVA